MPLPSFLRSKRSDILRVAAKHGALRVQVFGSCVRGDDSEASDLDILVSMREGTSLLDLIALGQELEETLARPVDVVSEAGLSPYLRERILREAIPL